MVAPEMETPSAAEPALRAEVGGMSPASWIRAIIELLEPGALTVDGVAQALGERFPSPDEVPVDDYVSYLIREQLVEQAERTHHFRLTEAGRTVCSGIIASPRS